MATNVKSVLIGGEKNPTYYEPTKPPTGLSIARSGSKFTFGWKIGDTNYGQGQKLKYMLVPASTKEKSLEVGTKTTSKSLTITKANYYPYTNKMLQEVVFMVQGRRSNYDTKDKSGATIHHKPQMSDMIYKSFNLSIPNAPSVSSSWSNDSKSSCTFSWSIATSETDKKMFSQYEWQSVLVKNSNITDGSKIVFDSKQLGWLTGNGTATSYSRTITENTTASASTSYTRWFRVRSRGPAGDSAWKYAKHVYAIPYQAVVSSATYKNITNGYQATVKWDSKTDASHPIDKTVIEYKIDVPLANMTCPAGRYDEEVYTLKDVSGTQTAVFNIDDKVDEDKCLWVRVNNLRDEEPTYGKDVRLVTGYLADPQGLSVLPDYGTYRVTIQATNVSEVPDSVLLVEYKPESGNGFICGVLGRTSTGEPIKEITVQCPDFSEETAIAFDVYTFVGKYTKVERSDGADQYIINSTEMKSKHKLTDGGAVPKTPTNLQVSRGNQDGTVQVTWDWNWKEANGAEISWSDHSDAWESTDEPDTFIISNIRAAKWNISNLETGKTWYVRVRFYMVVDDSITYGDYTEVEAGAIDLSSAPNVPALELSEPIISEVGTTTASWVYTTTDKTEQAFAQIGIFENGEYTPIPELTTTIQQHIDINASELGFETGNVYMIGVQVQSASGRLSEWSQPMGLTIAEPLDCSIAETSLVEETVVLDPEDDPEGRPVMVLKEMPFSIKVTGAGEGGTTIVTIERAQSYYLNRPDDDVFNGYEDETIYFTSQTGEDEIIIDVQDLLATLDDGAQFRIVATIKDGLGQSATDTLDFEVHWEHQAVKPLGTSETDHDYYIAKITPIKPEGAIDTDVADIYRLSADKPELIVKGGTFGETYVDPYPALGEFGGYRIVLRTANGDYITEDNEMAWLELTGTDGFDTLDNELVDCIINFGGETLFLYYDTDNADTWEKDFQETQYLGGSIQGDWNLAVSRSGNTTSKGITVTDQTMLKTIRKLAVYPGICHIRKADGSSYSANIDVSIDRASADRNMLENYSLSITRIDSQGFDGMTLEEWEEENKED